MNRFLTLATSCLSLVLISSAQQYPNEQRQSRDRDASYGNTRFETIPSGTEIRVRTDQSIDLRDPSDGRIYNGSVSEDVVGSDGKTLIPRGARAELIIQNLGERQM